MGVREETAAGMRVTLKLIGVAFSLLPAITAARAETISLAAQLLGSNAAPQNKSDAFGEGQFTYDSQTGKLDYYLTYDGTAPTRIDLHGPARPGDLRSNVISPARAGAELGWKPKVDLAAGLERTVSWFADRLLGAAPAGH